MIAIDSAQFRGTNGSAVPSGTPFQVALILRNSSVLNQAYNIRIVYTASDPLTQGIEIARSTVTIPTAVHGGTILVTIPALIQASEGTRGKVYVIAYPQCPKKRTSIMDCTNIVYPVGDLTVTRAAGRGGPLGVVYPSRIWEGSALRGASWSLHGLPFVVGNVTFRGAYHGGIKTPIGGTAWDMKMYGNTIIFDFSTDTTQGTTSMFFTADGGSRSEKRTDRIPANSVFSVNWSFPTRGITETLSTHTWKFEVMGQSWTGSFDAYMSTPEVEKPEVTPTCDTSIFDNPMFKPLALEFWSASTQCGISISSPDWDYGSVPVTTGISQRFKDQIGSVMDNSCVVNKVWERVPQLMQMAGCIRPYQPVLALAPTPEVAVVQAVTPPPPVCDCDPSVCFKAGDSKLQTALKRHKDACGNIIVDEWCPVCDPPTCYKPGDPKLATAKLKHKDACGNFIVDEWCDITCPKDPKDPRLPSGLLNWIKDICGCIVPKVRELSSEEIEKLNKAKAEAKGGSVVIARRTVVIENKPAGTPTGFSMAIEQPGMYSLYAPNVANITAAGSSKSDRIVLTTDNPNPTITTPSKNTTSVPKSIDTRLRDPQGRHTILTTDLANPSINLNVQSERFTTPVTLNDLTVGDPQHYHTNLTEPAASATASVNVNTRKVRGGYFSQKDDLPPALPSRLYVPGVYAPELPVFKGERTNIYAPGTAPVKKRK